MFCQPAPPWQEPTIQGQAHSSAKHPLNIKTTTQHPDNHSASTQPLNIKTPTQHQYTHSTSTQPLNNKTPTQQQLWRRASIL